MESEIRTTSALRSNSKKNCKMILTSCNQRSLM